MLGLIVLAGLPPLLLARGAAVAAAGAAGEPRARGVADAGAVAADLVAGLRPLKGIGGEAAAEARYRSASAPCREASVRAARATAAYEGVISLLPGCCWRRSRSSAGARRPGGDLSLGGLIAALGLTQFLIGPLSRLGWVGGELARARAAARRVRGVLEAPAAVGGSGDATAAGPHDAAGTLALRDVRHGPLAGVTFAAAPGELLGVAPLDAADGELLVRLLAREVDPEGERSSSTARP